MALVLIHHADADRMVVIVDGHHRPMEPVGGGWWQATRPDTPYRYGAIGHDGSLTTEPRDRDPVDDAPAVTVERWIVDTVSPRVRSSAIFHRAGTERPVEGSCVFRLFEPWIPRGHRPAVVGSTIDLGAWEPNDAVYLTAVEDGWWTAGIDPEDTDGLAYKYVIIAPDGTVRWEPGADRTLPPGHRELTVVDNGIDGLGGWRGAGVTVPVSALRSRTSLGIGQFTDLMPLAQWASSVGLGMIQILPVHDSIKHHDERDFQPYDPISVNALHPVYLDLRELVAHHPAAADRIGPELDIVHARFSVEAEYGEVMDTKWGLAAQCFEIMIDADAEAVSAFVEAEWEWLGSYAAWCVLRDAYGSPDPTDWGIDAAHDPSKVLAMADPSAGSHRSLAFHCWLQYHLHRQLATAVEFAGMAGVRLVADVTFGVSEHSVETWQSPEAFRPDRRVGAPPDGFAERGQNWRFPAWSWETAGTWWERRLTRLASTMDAFRLDHVLGFFRSWEIPDHADDARLGTFHPCLPLTADELAGLELTHAELTTPLIDDAVLADRFGGHADLIRSVCLTPDGDLVPAFTTQRGVQAAVAAGVVPAATEQPLVDLVADVLTIAVDGGYHPRAQWQQVERWRRLDPTAQQTFDAIAADFFHHRHVDLWRNDGLAILEPLLDATQMLATAEDLGMVPDFMATALAEVGMLGLRVERMPTDGWLADPADSPYLSVVTTGTHDMPTIRAWWETDRDRVGRYWREVLGQEGEPPSEAGPGICAAIVGRHLSSPAMLCVLPIQDLLAIDASVRSPDPHAEQINRPGVAHGQWRWRMPRTVEELLMAADLNERLRSLIAGSGR